MQIRNHRNPVAKLEYRKADGQWVAVPRTSWNYFVQVSPGMGSGPYTFRVTDSYGNVLMDSGIVHVAGGTLNGGSQFPARALSFCGRQNRVGYTKAPGHKDTKILGGKNRT